MSATSDFTATVEALDPARADYEYQLQLAFKSYYADRADELGGLPTDPDFAINPHFIHDGVRMFAKLMALAGEMYTRHKGTIDPFLDAALIALANSLQAHIADFKAMNNRGPT